MATKIGQFFPAKEKIGSISHASGVITLGPSHVRVGGLGVTVDSLTYTVSGLTADSLYMLYLVLNAGTPQLVASTNFNSVGPTGYSSWALVGAFYTNNSSQFGAFVTIEGTPVSDWATFTPTLYADTSNPNLGSSGVAQGTYKRIGNLIYVTNFFKFDGTGISNGSGAFYVVAPLSLTVDGSILTELNYIVGHGKTYDASNINNSKDYQCLINITNNRIYLADIEAGWANISSSYPSSWTATSHLDLIYQIPIVDWDNTPLKDK